MKYYLLITSRLEHFMGASPRCSAELWWGNRGRLCPGVHEVGTEFDSRGRGPSPARLSPRLAASTSVCRTLPVPPGCSVVSLTEVWGF